MIVGVYPGLSGALFFLDPNQPASGTAVDLPVHVLVPGGKKKHEVDVGSLIDPHAPSTGSMATRSPCFVTRPPC